jgi:hypothetical protein
MIEVQGYDRDHRYGLGDYAFAADTAAYSVENAITPALLGQYFRSFMSRLTMLEAQLGVMPTTGNSPRPSPSVFGLKYPRRSFLYGRPRAQR